MRAVDVIRKKRDGQVLSDEEIRFFCKGAVDQTIEEYQSSAFLMATYLRGMTDEETAALTMAMAESGDQVDLSSIEGVKVDKHSTGGVGDTTTLVLAPLVSACGARVAKMSGRGLGHTGGTLDKLESIPGVSVKLGIDQFLEQVRRIGLAVVSQTPTLVPADSLFYSLRDVTATVDCIPLIASSVMSKKIAAGCEVILLDVKVGSGAFMKTVEAARELGRQMVAIGNHLGRRVAAVISDMEAPLGAYIGNALEVREAIEILQGKHEGTPLWEVSLELSAHLLALANLATDAVHGRAMAEEALRSGKGLEQFRAMIQAQGGNGAVVDDVSLLPTARQVIPLASDRAGWLWGMDAEKIGEAAMHLGAGRHRKKDTIDPAVGIVLKVRPGDLIKVGDVVADLHVNDATHLEKVRSMVLGTLQWSDHAPPVRPLIREIVR